MNCKYYWCDGKGYGGGCYYHDCTMSDGDWIEILNQKGYFGEVNAFKNRHLRGEKMKQCGGNNIIDYPHVEPNCTPSEKYRKLTNFERVYLHNEIINFVIRWGFIICLVICLWAFVYCILFARYVV